MIQIQFEERIHSKQGNYIVAESEQFESLVKQQPLVIESETIMPGDFTQLSGWFLKPCRYVGLFESESKLNGAIFYLGSGESDLFQTGGVYYDVTYILGPDRIGKSYRPGTFRDCFLKKKNNKYYWK